MTILFESGAIERFASYCRMVTNEWRSLGAAGNRLVMGQGRISGVSGSQSLGAYLE